VAPEQSARAAPKIAFRPLRVLQSIIIAAQLVVMHKKKLGIKYNRPKIPNQIQNNKTA
jgi:hypothetical protein